MYKVIFFIVCVIVGLISVLYLDSVDNQFSYHDIIVEFHGLIFDLIVLGIILTMYEQISEKRQRIERYKEEIDDLRFWKSDEAMFRIKGIIKRLKKLGAGRIDLSNCYMKSCPTFKDMTSWNFTCSKLVECYFGYTNLKNSNFYLAEIGSTKFTNSDLSYCNFILSILENVHFEECDFKNVNLTYAYVENNNWFSILEKNNNIGVDYLRSNFKLTSNTIEINSKHFYQIVKIDEDDFAYSKDEIMTRWEMLFGIK